MKNYTLLIVIAVIMSQCKAQSPEKSSVKITPIEHATAVLTSGELTVYIDPTGDAAAFKSFSAPNYVFITDIHGDHFSINTLKTLDLSNASIVAPKVVADELPTQIAAKIIVLGNGETTTLKGLKAEAIPMYNLREAALKFHPKGRGNGYVFTVGGQRIYFSGDTEDIAEMRGLKNIDKAFLCMNLPYTMTVESAADAVLAFKPKEVYPYHYRGTDGLSDVAKFKELVTAKNPAIKVIQLDWYPKQ